MLTTAVSRARRKTKSTIAGSSMTGLVSGMQTSVVTPPAAAASLAVLSVSRCSAPGSPVKARMSTRPGASTRPAQPMTVTPSGGARRGRRRGRRGWRWRRGARSLDPRRGGVKNPLPFSGRGWRAERAGRGGEAPIDRCQDSVQDELAISEHEIIREAKHNESLAPKPGVTCGILGLLLRRVVERTVQFDDHLRGNAEEVDDIGRDRDLPLELVTFEPPGADLLPEQRFGARHGRALPLCEIAQALWNLIDHASLLAHLAPSPGSLRSPPSPTKGERVLTVPARSVRHPLP